MQKPLIDQLITELFKLEVIDFIGLAKLMGVEIVERNKEEVLPTEEIIANILNEFETLSNTKKKEIIKICKAANKKVKKNGNRTKNRN